MYDCQAMRQIPIRYQMTSRIFVCYFIPIFTKPKSLIPSSTFRQSVYVPYYFDSMLPLFIDIGMTKAIFEGPDIFRKKSIILDKLDVETII